MWSPEADEKMSCRTDGIRRDYCSPNLFSSTSPVLLVNDGAGHFSDGTARARLPRDATKVEWYKSDGTRPAPRYQRPSSCVKM